MENSIWFVCLFGIGTVFVGLTILVFLTMLLGFLANRPSKEQEQQSGNVGKGKTAENVPAVEGTLAAERKQKLVAAIITAVLEEELDGNSSELKIVSITTIG